MNITSMHFAFLTSSSVNKQTPLGKLIIDTVHRHYDSMVKAQNDRSIALAKQAERLANTLDVE